MNEIVILKDGCRTITGELASQVCHMINAWCLEGIKPGEIVTL